MSKVLHPYTLPLLLLTLLLALGCLSCSVVDKIVKQQNEMQLKTVDSFVDKSCSPTPDNEIRLIHQDKHHLENLQLFFAKHGRDLSLVEKFVMMAMIEMNNYPHASSPTANLQIWFLQNDGKSSPLFYHSNFSSNEGQAYSFLYSLDTLLKSRKTKKSLMQLAAILDKQYAYAFRVNGPTMLFIRKNASLIQANETLKSYYTKGNQLIKQGETIPAINWVSIIKRYLATPKVTYYIADDESFLVGQSNIPPQKSIAELRCNFDHKNYNPTFFKLYEQESKYNFFGIISSHEVFLAASAQDENKSSALPLGDSLLFSGNGKANPVAFCYSPKNNFLLISQAERDPRQILSQNIKSIQSSNEYPDISSKAIEKMYRIPRSLHLTNPARIIYEKGITNNRNKTDDLLKGDTEKEIGNVNIIWKNKEDQRYSFFLDPRGNDYINCQ